MNHHHHPRSASTSVPDRKSMAKSQFLETKKRNHHRTASGGGNLLAPPSGTAPSGSGPGAGTSPHSVKDTFLNYFLGGQGGPSGMGGPGGVHGTAVSAQHVSSAPGSSDGRTERKLSRPQASNFTSKEILPDLASGRRQTNRNFESGTTAYDMKSLGKHLESGAVDQLHLSPREEMETNLIRSLIASYFGIVRQTIQDLVPKAIMHLLVCLSLLWGLCVVICDAVWRNANMLSRSTFHEMRFNNAWSPRCTSLTSLPTCYSKIKH